MTTADSIFGPLPPEERVVAPTLHSEGVLTLHWYGSEVEVLIDGEPVPLTEWFQERQNRTISILLSEKEKP